MLIILPLIACMRSLSPLLLPLAQFGLPLLLAWTTAVVFQLAAQLSFLISYTSDCPIKYSKC